MKIEIGESLLLSWLRHVKGCQLVQMNWKPSSRWTLMNEDIIQGIMYESEKFFSDSYKYKIYKNNSSLRQLIQQAEIDVIGVAIQGGEYEIYAIDVAFHGAGLNYGKNEETVSRVIKKIFRTAMCIYGLFGYSKGEIVFTSPKIHNNVLEALFPCISQIEEILSKHGLGFKIHLIANEDFNDKIFQPVLEVSSNVADTSELFLRSIQLYNLFLNKQRTVIQTENFSAHSEKNARQTLSPGEPKIGAFVQTKLRELFENDEVTPEEVDLMQTAEYSREIFHIQFPLLIKASRVHDNNKLRYWSKPVTIFGEEYFICSQWYEKENNNDRPYFEKWLNMKLETQ